MEEMKPCPFCGQNKVKIKSFTVEDLEGKKYVKFFPLCENPDCFLDRMRIDDYIRTSQFRYNTEEEAIKAWNTRPIENYRDSMIYDDMLKVIELADRYGWNGVDNSKILSTFLEDLLKKLTNNFDI